MNILVAEDELRIADLVSVGLKEHGFVVSSAGDGAIALAMCMNDEYDAVILDIGLPSMDGLSVLRQLRVARVATPVLILTARGDLDDRVTGLNLGADDYVTKPFFVEEVVARLFAVLRRHAQDRSDVLTVGALSLDRMRRVVQVRGAEVSLTAREFNLLECLMRSPGRIFTRTQILQRVWGYDFNPNTNVVDVCVQRIRRKIDAPKSVSAVESVHGVGYRFRIPQRNL